MSERYPESPGWKGDLETGKNAAKEIADTLLGGLRRRCLASLVWEDRTADEIAATLNVSILSIRPRISELREKGLIEDTGLRRPNASGKLAAVWRAK